MIRAADGLVIAGGSLVIAVIRVLSIIIKKRGRNPLSPAPFGRQAEVRYLLHFMPLHGVALSRMTMRPLLMSEAMIVPLSANT